ncbi:MAG: DIP1984 family protein [Clostridiales bacterium]|jgi:hypothetical protein|nr:DIP1984 family protein [Clostridiales bacterium]
MKLAELLIERSDCQKRISELESAVRHCLRVQEGDEPPQSPQKLLAEIKAANARLAELVWLIARANYETKIDGKTTLAQALARRDAIKAERDTLIDVIEEASRRDFRGTKSEIKTVVTVDVAELQKQSDKLARQYRELDTKIQERNWTTEIE